jgi:hypothetical protein
MIVILVWTGLSVVGLFVFSKLVHVDIRHKDTETVGLAYAIVAVVYAVLIAFIVVNVFETASHADEIATAEANELSSLTHDSAGLPPQLAEEVRLAVNRYVDIVVDSEWPSQQTGKLEDAVYEPGWTVLAGLSTKLAAFEPQNMGQNVNKAQMLQAMDDLIKARRSRIQAASDHLPDVVWQILILAGVLAVGFTYLFGAHSFKIHMAITALISATIALVFVLIIALDYPFRGEVSVGDEAFKSIKVSGAEPLNPAVVKIEHAH